jgi:antitoxin component HigA of HigAB toxin-antitoxin module
MRTRVALNGELRRGGAARFERDWSSPVTLAHHRALSRHAPLVIDRREAPPPNRIRELREARGLTLEDLAHRVGTTNQQISHLELGKRQLTVEWLRRLAKALDCHPWAIVEDQSG